MKQLKVFPILNFAQYPELYLMVFLFFSCNKPYNGGFIPGPAICSKENTVAFPSDAFDRLYFKDSTYWIYQDSISKETDSVWVTNSKMETFNEFRNKQLYKKCYEGHHYELNSTKDGKRMVSLYPQSVNDDTKYEEEYFTVYYHLGAPNYNTIYRFRIKGNIYLQNEIGGEIDTFQKLEIGGNNYTNLLHLKYSTNSNDYYSNAYFAPIVGLVKYKTLDGRVWELIRSKINK